MWRTNQPTSAALLTGSGLAVATTYAGFGQNDTLVKRAWDAIVADESHHILSNSKGDETTALEALRAAPIGN